MQRLKSRKFLLTILTVIIAACGALGNAGSPMIQIVCIIVAAAATIAYNIIEGKIDAAAVATVIKTTVDSVSEIMEKSESAKTGGQIGGISTSGTPPDNQAQGE